MSIDLLKTFKACGFAKIDDQLASDLTKIVDWQQKLKKVKPISIGQATRISGVNPSDIAVLAVYLKKEYNAHE